jgi:hypothetical protein
VSPEVQARVISRLERGLTAQQARDAIAYLRRLQRKEERAA